MAEASDIAKRRIVYALEGDIEVSVRQEIPYRTTETETLTFDLYRPASAATPLPVVVFVIGFSDVGTRTFVGCNAKDMQCYVSWANLMATSGLAAVTYTTTAPTTDVHDLLHHLRREQDALGIDASSLGLWACSGNVPNALGLLMSEDRISGAPLCVTGSCWIWTARLPLPMPPRHFVSPTPARDDQSPICLMCRC